MLLRTLKQNFPVHHGPPADGAQSRERGRLRYERALLRLREAGVPTREDPEAGAREYVESRAKWEPGIAAVARLFGPASGALRRGAEAAASGGWDRRAMLRVEAWCLLRALAEPRTLLSRTRFKYHGRMHCPAIRTIRRDDRRIPDDVEGWMHEVARTHPDGVSW